MPAVFTHPITIYYEDTDFSGYVYHANYLKYFERAREELLGVERLVTLYRDEGVGFVVYKAELQFKEAAVHGDRLEVRTTVRAEGTYRAIFEQSIWRRDGKQPLVTAVLQLVCVDRAGKLVELPTDVLQALLTEPRR
jgi:acyl-CoA thioester hydrolase